MLLKYWAAEQEDTKGNQSDILDGMWQAMSHTPAIRIQINKLQQGLREARKAPEDSIVHLLV